jgi:hypothetical protein
LGAAKAPGRPLQFRLAISGFLAILVVWLLRNASRPKMAKPTHGCALISACVPAPLTPWHKTHFILGLKAFLTHNNSLHSMIFGDT